MFHAELGKSTFDIWEEEQREKRIAAYRRNTTLTQVAKVLDALREQKSDETPIHIRHAKEAAEAASKNALAVASGSTRVAHIAERLITPEIGTTEWKIGGNNE